MAESELPEEIPVDLLLASTDMKVKTPELQDVGEVVNIDGAPLIHSLPDRPGITMNEIDPEDHNSEGYFTGHGGRSNQGMAMTSQGRVVAGPSRVWYNKSKDMRVTEDIKEETNDNGQSKFVARQAPRIIPVTPKGLREIAGNLIMDYLLAEQNGCEMNLPQAVMLTAKQRQGTMLAIPVGSSELYRINPEDWVGIEELLQNLRFSLLPSEEGVLFRSQVEIHPDFAAMMVLQGL
jgi:hypothetical protein